MITHMISNIMGGVIGLMIVAAVFNWLNWMFEDRDD